MLGLDKIYIFLNGIPWKLNKFIIPPQANIKKKNQITSKNLHIEMQYIIHSELNQTFLIKQTPLIDALGTVLPLNKCWLRV